MAKRFFSSSQRVSLYIASQGKCAICGRKLKPGWHADHKRPYSKGGETDTLNGQALCPQCDQSKGAKEENEHGKTLA